MAKTSYTTRSIPISQKVFNGGLNTTAGPFGLSDSESSDLQNIDFDKFGSIIKRNGYSALNTSAISGTPRCDCLHWFELDNSGTIARKLVNVSGAKLFKMDDLDGTWDDITGGLTITANNKCDSETFLNTSYFTNNEDVPFEVDNSLAASASTVPTGLTKAKFVAQFNNYLFYANVEVSAARHRSRIYYSVIKNTSSWSATHYIEISKGDGQEITGFRVLGDRLVIYKNRAIYNLFFTGDPTIPFILSRSNSSVGCIAGFSIQEINNRHVFLSSDGIYMYDGLNSLKISGKITTTLNGYNSLQFSNASSLIYAKKNQYWLALTDSGSSSNDKIIIWDYAINAFSIFDGISASSMETLFVGGLEERPYFSDYLGFTYRGDFGSDDYPLNVQTAIDAYYYTNWKAYGDLVDQKATTSVYIYHRITNSVLTFSFSFDFEDSDQYTQQFSLSTSASVYGIATYGVGTYAGNGGKITRRDLPSRGRVVRMKFSNNTLSETFRIDGLGMSAYLETNV